MYMYGCSIEQKLGRKVLYARPSENLIIPRPTFTIRLHSIQVNKYWQIVKIFQYLLKINFKVYDRQHITI